MLRVQAPRWVGYKMHLIDATRSVVVVPRSSFLAGPPTSLFAERP